MSVAKEIRIKIKSIENTKKITKAMEMVAASKMRKAQDRMVLAKPYAKKIRHVVGHVALSHPEYPHPFLQARPVKRMGMIIVTSDRGLCGGLNNNLLRLTLQKIKAIVEQGIEVDLCLIGTKAESFFRRFGGKVLASATHLGDAPTVAQLIGIVKVMLDAYLNHQIDELYIGSNKFLNTMTQRPEIEQLLPVVPTDTHEVTGRWDYIYEPDDARILLEQLLTRYIESQVYQAVIENIACEQSARMVAMKNATSNAKDLIDRLKIAYNKARQTSITQELTEIVAGAAAV